MIPSTSLMTMGSCMWVWIWVWEYLCLSVGAQVNKIAKGFPVECNTTVGYVEQNYAAASEMRCALLANKNAALEYIYDGTMCTLLGEGLGISDARGVGFTKPYPLGQTLQEVANNKPTYGAPHNGNYISSKAVDGNDAKLSIYANEDRFLFPWWLVDLGDTYLIHKIVILPRYNNYMHHFHDIEIRVGTQLDTSGDLGTYKLFSTYKGPYPAPKWEKQLVVCERRDGVLGRYASLKRVTAEYRELIHLNEFRVYAIPAH
ncbi:uncharacterized protein LOC121863398 [Homarus americanus]|uniref:uncharacterized protein LOC121863398 n=1 Tax=Homarus americanus TaxID=6706 RepID=UPI001C446AC7|nr:uncharacterized protein LOC121863398 [Homarus americanus]